MARCCVFCGKTPCTNEHVLPRWLETAFPTSTQRDTLHVRRTESTQTERRGNLLDATARVVCGTCNSGWMNELEEGVRLFLPRMIKGKEVKLTKTRQTSLASWSVKTVMMLQCLYSKDDQVAIPSDDYTAFYNDKRPSDFIHIWTAYMTPPIDPFGITEHPAQFFCQPHESTAVIQDEGGLHTATGPAYVATFRLGHLVVQVLRLGAPGIMFDLEPSPALVKCITPVWPAFSTRQWPPGSLDTIGGFNVFASALSTPLPS